MATPAAQTSPPAPDMPSSTTTAAAAITEPDPSSSPPPAEDSNIAPSTETPAPTTTNNASTGPALDLSLMLITGARHPYRLDERYLSSRSVTAANPTTGAFDPRELSGYQLKELILKDWRPEWEPKPASPSSIRLIIMGRMIEDKAALKDFPFSPTSPNVVHLSVKPPEVPDDDETAGKSHTGKGGTLRQRDGGEGGAGCRCVIL